VSASRLSDTDVKQSVGQFVAYCDTDQLPWISLSYGRDTSESNSERPRFDAVIVFRHLII
jgi:hypothetical protein